MVTDEDIAALRQWAERQGDGARAALGLLIEHDHWLWNDEFEARYVRRERGEVYLDFTEMGRFNPSVLACSESQAAILLVAADIGSGRWRIFTMDGRNRERIVRAVATVAGMER
jgi:hypothetical protein